VARTFASPGAFKRSLEDRLRSAATEREVSIDSIRLKLVMERLLARLFEKPHPPWLLKGGFAMELRYRPRARTTRDLDLSIRGSDSKISVADDLALLQEELRTAASRDLGDYFVFTLGESPRDLQAPLGGFRLRCECRLAGTQYAVFRLDVGLGDPTLQEPEVLVGGDLLAFAGIEPAVVLAVPTTQHFAEKLHAYTFPWSDRTNTRTKDLADLLLLLEEGLGDSPELREALRATFRRRATHPLPENLPPPPANWQPAFAQMADELKLPQADLESAHLRLANFWRDIFAPGDMP
jgi:Nucleotidyl transferase AbiEii toxin, Type IV TA system